MSNYMALVMGRDAKDSHARTKGMSKPLIIYTSKESHYSNDKNASFAGIGRDNIRYIKSDSVGRMIPSALEEQVKKDIEDGLVPTYVNSTAGTTVLGAFDPINEIADSLLPADWKARSPNDSRAGYSPAMASVPLN